MPRYIDITLDKKHRRLRYDINALDTLEKTLGGMPLGDIVVNLRNVSVRVLRVVLWTGFLHEEKGLTQERVGNEMQAFLDNGGTFLELSQYANDAIEGSGVVKKEEDAVVEASDPSPETPTTT